MTTPQPELGALNNDLALLDDDDSPLPLPHQLDPALHRHQPGQSISDPDQHEIRRLIQSAQQTPQHPASDAQIRVIQGKYGRHCFAVRDKEQSLQTISIVRSVRQCVCTKEVPSSNAQSQPFVA